MKKLTTLLRHFAGVSAFAAALCLALPNAFAGAGGAPGGGSDDPSTGDDDIGTLPSLAEETLPSLVFIGSLSEIQGVILGVSGSGTMTVQAAGSGMSAVIFDGNLKVRVDLAAFSQSGVQASFSVGNAFAGGIASIYAGGGWSPVTSLETLTASTGFLDLPLDAIGSLGAPVGLTAQSLDADLYKLRATSGGGVLTLTQSINPAGGRTGIGL